MVITDSQSSQHRRCLALSYVALAPDLVPAVRAAAAPAGGAGGRGEPPCVFLWQGAEGDMRQAPSAQPDEGTGDEGGGLGVGMEALEVAMREQILIGMVATQVRADTD